MADTWQAISPLSFLRLSSLFQRELGRKETRYTEMLEQFLTRSANTAHGPQACWTYTFKPTVLVKIPYRVDVSVDIRLTSNAKITRTKQATSLQ